MLCKTTVHRAFIALVASHVHCACIFPWTCVSADLAAPGSLTFSECVDRVGRLAGLAATQLVDRYHPERVHGVGQQPGDVGAGHVSIRLQGLGQRRPAAVDAQPAARAGHRSGQLRSDRIRSDQVRDWSGQVRSGIGQGKSDQFRSDQVRLN